MAAPPPYEDVTADHLTKPSTSEKTFLDQDSTIPIKPIKAWHITSHLETETKSITNGNGEKIYHITKKDKKLFTKHRHPELLLHDTTPTEHVLASVKLNAKTEQHEMCVAEDPSSKKTTLQEIMVSWQGDAFHFIVDRRGMEWRMELTESFGTFSLWEEGRAVGRYESEEGGGGRLMFLDGGLGEKVEVAGLMGIVAVEEGMKIAREENRDGRHGDKFAGAGGGGGMEGSVGAGFSGGGIM